MPAARPIWKGHIRLSLVSIPVELFTATKTSEKIAFRQIHEPTGKPIHYQKVVAGVGPVDTDEILKGFEYEKGRYVLMDEEDLDAVRTERRRPSTWRSSSAPAISRRSISTSPITSCRRTSSPRTPTASSGRAAEERDGRPRPARLRGKEVPGGAQALRQRPAAGDAPIMRRKSARRIVLQRDPATRSRRGSARGDAGADQAQGGAADPAAFKNHYTQALRELINLRIKGKAPKVETEEEARPSGDNVIDLMAALKKSLAGGGETCAGGAERRDGRAVRARRTRSGQSRPQTRRAEGAKIGLSHGAELPTALPNIALADFAATSEPAGKVASEKGIASSSRSTPPRGCTTISASSSTGS